MTPTSRSLELLRREGYLAAVVEKWIPRVNVRSDLWHFGDVLAVHPDRKAFLIVQTTSLPNISSRLKKGRGRPELSVWLAAGGKFQLHGWYQHDGRWRCKRVDVNAGDMQPVVIEPKLRKARKSRWQEVDLFAGLGETS